MKPALVLIASTLLLAMAAPAGALPGELPAASLTAETVYKKGEFFGVRLSWEYPEEIRQKDVAGVEVWRFDGVNSATLVLDKKQTLKRMEYVDEDADDSSPFYTIRYFLNDGSESAFSQAVTANYPWCTVLVVGTEKPFLSGPYSRCLLPPPASEPYWSFTMETVQYLIG